MGFAGEIPKITPRLLPNGAAQTARNCKLQDGSLVPLRYPNDYRVLADGDVMFYKRGATWFEWNKVVDVVPAPIAEDRLYMTGDGVPKIIADTSTVYPLKVAAPTDQLAATAIQTTGNLDFDATAGEVQTALESLSSIGTSNVVCTGGPLPGTPINIEFVGGLALRYVAKLTKGANALTGGSSPDVSVAHTTPGSSTANDEQDLTISGTPTGGTFKLSIGEEPNPQTQYSTIYAYAYVTAYDEESEPSPVSAEVLTDPTLNVTLSSFVAPPTDRNYNRIRIYRSQTSALGVTELFLINEQALPVPSPSWEDVVADNPIQEVIPSIDYNPPPDNLSGIIALPNGMLAGFVGKKLYLSEPWIPHAWPEKYVQTVDFTIIGLGAFGSSIAIMTDGQPYVCTGISPDVMTLERLEFNLPCINKHGIVDLGYSVAYPSPNGLAVIGPGGAQMVSRNLWNIDQWREMSPETWVSAQYDGRYIASHSYGDMSGVIQDGTLIIDLTGEQPFLSRTDLKYDFMFFEIGAGRLYVLNDNNMAQEWDSDRQQFMSMTWKSKPFMLPADSNYGAIRVDGEILESGFGNPSLPPFVIVEDATLVNAIFSDTVVGSTGTPPSSVTPFQCRVYADDVLKRSFTDFNKVTRLPGGFLARKWEIQIEGQRQVDAIYLAMAPSELIQGEIK
jgi:hypothetical protein